MIKYWQKSDHKILWVPYTDIYFQIVPKERKLVFLYLANDIMQTSRKRGGEFIREFSKVLTRAVQHVHRYIYLFII